MKLVRILLFPFAFLYGFITTIRNFLYDKEILKSYSFTTPIIVVGNLSVGGTGKTPQIEYLINLLSDNYNIATLSRGYKRKSKGFILADKTATAQTLGDEPFQIYLKFPKIAVAVDTDRKNGIEKLIQLPKKPDVILLDDAFQHRRVKAGFYILLTAFDDLFCDDFVLPTGNLREPKKGANRANCIIVTKCSKDLSESDQNKIKLKIGLNIPIFFSYTLYDSKIYNNLESLDFTTILQKEKLLVAGIAKPKSFFDYFSNAETLSFSDHHNFSENDVDIIKSKGKNKVIITTEKDFVRLMKFDIKSLYYLPISTIFLNKSRDFNDLITNFIKKINS